MIRARAFAAAFAVGLALQVAVVLAAWNGLIPIPLVLTSIGEFRIAIDEAEISGFRARPGMSRGIQTDEGNPQPAVEVFMDRIDLQRVTVTKPVDLGPLVGSLAQEHWSIAASADLTLHALNLDISSGCTETFLLDDALLIGHGPEAPESEGLLARAEGFQGFGFDMTTSYLASHRVTVTGSPALHLIAGPDQSEPPDCTPPEAP